MKNELEPERRARLEEELLFCVADDLESTTLVLEMMDRGSEDEESLLRFEEGEDKRALVHSCLTSLVLRGYVEVLEEQREGDGPGKLIPTEPPADEEKDRDYWWGLTKKGRDFVLDYLRSVEVSEESGAFMEETDSGRQGYEHRLLMFLHRDLILRPPEWSAPRGGRIEIERVRHRHSAERPEGSLIQIFFRDRQRPECLFGAQFDAVEPVPPLLVEDPDHRGHYVYASDRVFDENKGRFSPEGYADVIRANLKELIFARDLGLPEDCESEGVTWI